jgi:DNA-binding NarL/FixJ family response regulator
VAAGAGAMNPSLLPPQTDPVRVLIADDHPVLRHGLRALLEASGLTVVGEANTGIEAVQLALTLQPNVVLMDIDMPEMNGIEATKRIHAKLPQVRILILTMFHDDKSVFAAMQVGAHGYLLKGSQKQEMLQAIQGVAAGGVIFCPGVAEQVMKYFAVQKNDYVPDFPELTSREQEVLELIAQHKSNAEIAHELQLAPKTVRNYVSLVLSKLHMASRAKAILVAKHSRSVTSETT